MYHPIRGPAWVLLRSTVLGNLPLVFRRSYFTRCIANVRSAYYVRLSTFGNALLLIHLVSTPFSSDARCNVSTFGLFESPPSQSGNLAVRVIELKFPPSALSLYPSFEFSSSAALSVPPPSILERALSLPT